MLLPKGSHQLMDGSLFGRTAIERRIIKGVKVVCIDGGLFHAWLEGRTRQPKGPLAAEVGFIYSASYRQCPVTNRLCLRGSLPKDLGILILRISRSAGLYFLALRSF